MACTLKPAPWFMAMFVLFIVVVSGALALMWSGFSPVVVFVAPIGGGTGFYRMMTLRMDADGVSYLKRHVEWGDLALVEKRFASILEARTGSTPLSQRMRVSLRTYEWNWRDGQIGRCLAEWAPHLLRDQGHEAGGT